MESPTTKTGIIYCRVSSKDQVDGTSLEMQEKVCKEYAQREGIQILQIFIERGESAKTIDRTEFTKALALCSRKKSKVDCFIVYKLDRFSRNHDDYVMVRQMLKKYETEIRSATEPIDNTPIGKVVEGMVSLFAELENSIRRERCMAGLKERLKQGVWCFPVPLGYQRVIRQGQIVLDPKVAPYIHLIFEEYAKGIHTYNSLAKLLGAQGFRTKHGKLPTKQIMQRILKTSLYTGIIDLWGERVKGNFEPIITEKIFQQCQGSSRHIPALSVPRLQQNPEFPLRKLVVCAVCKTPLTGSSSRGQSGQKYPYYHHPRQTCEYALSLPKDQLEKKFIKFLKDITPDTKYLKLIRHTALTYWKSHTQLQETKVAQWKREITVLEDEFQKVFNYHRSGVYSDTDFLHQKKLLSYQISQKQQLIAEYQPIDSFNLDEALDFCFQYIRKTPQLWEESDYPIKLHLQKLVFAGGQVTFDGEKFGTPQMGRIYAKNLGFSDENTPTGENVPPLPVGTPNLSLIYRLNQMQPTTKSHMVELLRLHWNRWVKELKEWKLFSDIVDKSRSQTTDSL